MRRERYKWMPVVVVLLAGLLGAGSLLAEEGEPMKVTYKFGKGLKITDGDNLVELVGRVQGRFQYDGLEGAPDSDTWSIRRGKIKLKGYTFKKKLHFGFQFNLATRSGDRTTTVCTNADCSETATVLTRDSESGVAELEDAYVDYVPYNFFAAKVGQYKVPFLMQELTSSGKQQFVDRSSSTGFFNLSRDIGLNLHGPLWDNGVEYNFFFMNGDGSNNLNRNQSFLFGTRFDFPILGEYEASESDVGYSEEPNYGIGIAYNFNELGSSFVNGTIPAGIKTSLATLDTGLKYKGFSTQGAIMLARAHEGVRMTHWGYNAQVGYFFVPKHFEVALRGAGTIFSDAIVNQYEYAAALNYFIKGHGFKIQTDYAVLLNARGANLNDHRVRSQLQLVF